MEAVDDMSRTRSNWIDSIVLLLRLYKAAEAKRLLSLCERHARAFNDRVCLSKCAWLASELSIRSGRHQAAVRSCVAAQNDSLPMDRYWTLVGVVQMGRVLVAQRRWRDLFALLKRSWQLVQKAGAEREAAIVKRMYTELWLQQQHQRRLLGVTTNRELPINESELYDVLRDAADSFGKVR